MNCILALQEEYSFALCLSGCGDQRLPTSIRAAFANLLVDLWLDRYPHVQIIVPAIMRPLPDGTRGSSEGVPAFETYQEHVPFHWSEQHLQSLPEEVHAFSSLSRPHRMEALVRLVRRYLCVGPEVEQQVHSATDDNVLTLAILRIVSFLLRFGLFPSMAVLNELLGPLLRMLDGRTDFLEPVATGASKCSTGNPACEDSKLPEPLRPLLQCNSPAPSDGTLLAKRTAAS